MEHASRNQKAAEDPHHLREALILEGVFRKGILQAPDRSGSIIDAALDLVPQLAQVVFDVIEIILHAIDDIADILGNPVQGIGNIPDQGIPLGFGKPFLGRVPLIRSCTLRERFFGLPAAHSASFSVRDPKMNPTATA